MTLHEKRVKGLAQHPTSLLRFMLATREKQIAVGAASVDDAAVIREAIELQKKAIR